MRNLKVTISSNNEIGSDGEVIFQYGQEFRLFFNYVYKRALSLSRDTSRISVIQIKNEIVDTGRTDEYGEPVLVNVTTESVVLCAKFDNGSSMINVSPEYADTGDTFIIDAEGKTIKEFYFSTYVLIKQMED